VKAGTLLDAPTAQMLGFEWLREALAPASEYGERIFAGGQPFRRGDERLAGQRAERIAGVARAVDDARLDAARDLLRSAPDAVGAIARASMDDVLTDIHFFELQRLIDAVERVDVLFDGVPGISAAANQGARDVAAALEPGRSGKFGFYLADAFDAALAGARARFLNAQTEFDLSRGRLMQRVAAALGRDDLGGDEFIVMRSDAPAALPVGVRVVREAPTYLLCVIEYDDATVRALERREAAAEAVAHAEAAVRRRLSSVVRENVAFLDRTIRALGDIDVVVAAARFTRLYQCEVAQIVSHPDFAFRAGRFLPLEAEIEADGRRFTPVDVELQGVALLTGPNMGGKSVCLRTCGFIALCAALGLPVPAASARTALFDEIAWLGIGTDGDVPGSLLSSFAGEVVRLRDVLQRGAQPLFVLIDEFARTTTPHEGKALLIAVLQRLRERNACGMAATHLAGVARVAGVRHFAVRGLRGIPKRPATTDLHEALAALAASMDYTIAEVGEGEENSGADAIALAQLLGLDQELVAAAYRALK
jgi:DNA mismatch repair protein MutS2